MDGAPEPFSGDCLVPQTVKHLMVECPSLSDERLLFLNYARIEGGLFNLSKILSEGGIFNRTGLFGFLDSSNF